VRLGRAGCERELFASDAVAMLHEGARGALREAARLPRAGVRAFAERTLGIDAMGRRYEAWYERVAAGAADRLVAA